MRNSSRHAAMFISLMVVSGVTVLIKGALSMHAMHHFQFLSLLVLAVLTSRLKVRLPGLTGNMSVNLPFLFVAIVQLSLLEAAVIALASTLVQTWPKRGNRLKPFHMLFNLGTVTTAAGFSYLVFRSPLWGNVPDGSLSLALASSTYFLMNTLPVATIISLTEGAKLVRTWLGIAHLSFPYYVAGTGITSIVMRKSGSASWLLPLAIFPVMFFVYRSYRIYFRGASTAQVADRVISSPPLARQHAAGAI